MTDPGSFMSQNFETDFSKEDLLKLLLQFEAELENKEEKLAVLKDDKAHMMLNQAKYGKLMMMDPLLSLGRDGLEMNEKLDQTVLSVYEYQQRELERLCQLHKSNHVHYKEVIINMEKRHKKIIDELRNEIHRNQAVKSQKEDIVLALEESRDSLAKELETKNDDLGKLQKALQLEKSKREREKNDHKLMIKYLLSERRDLFLTLRKLKLELTHKNGSGTTTGDSPLVHEMRKEIDTLRLERNKLAGIAQELQKQNTDLNQKLKIKEEDLQTLRQNITKIKQEPMNRSNIAGGLVVANRGALAAVSQSMPSRSRLPNSSSFPSTAPGTSVVNGLQKQQPGTPMYKKFPTASPALGSLSRNRGVPYLGTKASNLPITRGAPGQQKGSVQPEIEHLGMIIDSMNSQQLNSTISKRSSSLPRSPQSKAEAASHHIKPPVSGIPTHPQRQTNTNQKTSLNSSTGKNSRISTTK